MYDDPKKKKLPAIVPAEQSIDVTQPLPEVPAVAQPPAASMFSLPAITPDEPSSASPDAALPAIANSPDWSRWNDGNLPAIAPSAAPTLPEIPTDTPIPPKDSTTAPVNLPAVDPIEAELQKKTGELTSASQYHDKHWTKWDKIAAALEGWAKGGIFNAVKAVKDPHYFEDQRIAEDRARLLPQIGALQQIRDTNLTAKQKQAQTAYTTERPAIEHAKIRQKAIQDKATFDQRQSLLDQKQKFDGGQWTRYEDADGKVFKKFKDGRMEPVEFNGVQDRNPAKIMYDTVSLLTGQPVKVTGAQLYSGEAQVAAGNAQREQGANTTNANNELEAQRANVTNAFNYSKTLFDKAAEIAKTNGESQGAFTSAQGLHTQLGQAAEKLQSLDPVVNEKEYTAAQKNFNELQEKFYQAISKTQSGAAAVQQMTAQGVARPGVITAPKIKASKVSGKVARSADVDAFAKSKNWTRAQAENYLTNNGYTIQ